MRNAKRFSMPLIPGLFFVALSAHTTHAQTPQKAGASGPGNAKSPAAGANQARAKAAPATKIKFKPYYQMDQQLGMPAHSVAIPEDWKGMSRVVWNINAYYQPVDGQIRVEAPDGGSWVELYGQKMFEWGKPAFNLPWGVAMRSGAIHHANVSLPEALVRYVIVPNRRNARNLRILGYRPVNNLPKAFSHLFTEGVPKGNGICMRVQYELDGTPVDEEFYGFMPPPDAIPSPPSAVEYHSYLMLAHSMGAKSGKLESMRPLLGYIAKSNNENPAWSKQVTQIHQALMERASQNLAQSWENVRIGKQLSEQAHASNEAFLARTDASLAQSRQQQAAAHASNGAGANDEFYKNADGFIQYMRGTEHMQDQNGVVTDQYTDYNYHWTDGNGRFVHANDASFDPNQYLNGSYQQMTPARQ
jgi:hypothetical protein